MKIIVSIKQVPDTSGKVAVNPDGTLNRASMQTITNPDDMNALEAALKIKDATGCKVVMPAGHTGIFTARSSSEVLTIVTPRLSLCRFISPFSSSAFPTVQPSDTRA